MPIANEKALEDGKVLQYLKLKYIDNQCEETGIPFFRCLIDSNLWIPMYVANDPFSEETLKNLKVGDVIQADDPVRLRADYLKNGDDLFFPMFSAQEEAPEEYRNRFSWLPMSIDQCIDFAEGKEDCDGIVLDAFSSPFIIKDEILKLLKSFLEYAKEFESKSSKEA